MRLFYTKYPQNTQQTPTTLRRRVNAVANGTLGGYAYGLNRKKQLLEPEKEMDKMAEDGQFGTKDGHIGRDFRVGT
ncbi:MAG: MGMT family protein [Paludibacteraceae bacterium]|nr:MGMT family protein [Paludibacteraceae bacterium]